MRKYQISFGVFITSLILFTGFKKNPGQENILTEKSAPANNHVVISKEPVKVSIAGTTAIQGDKGQRLVKAMVYLSRAATEPVTVKYKTENGSAKAGVDYVGTNGSIRFEPGESVKWITVPIIGEVAADPDEGAATVADLEFEVNLNNAIGAIIENSEAIITIIKNVLSDPRFSGGNQAVYEVIISYTGYTSFLGDNTEECGIRRDGVVVLSGLLKGIENVGPKEYDDITYTGNLEMIIDMDICSSTRSPNSSEDKYCGIRVVGSGTVYTELDIYYGTDTAGKFDGRGGYIKTENKDGKFKRTVTGECDEAQIDEEWTMVPNKSIASVFNGAGLPKLTTRTLRKGTYTDVDDQGNKTVVEVLRKIR